MGCSRAEAASALSAVLGAIEEGLVNRDRVVLTGFGTFAVRQVGQRRVRSIQQGRAHITVPAHNRVGFVPGADLRAAV